jgi:hypothetical protein
MVDHVFVSWEQAAKNFESPDDPQVLHMPSTSFPQVVRPPDRWGRTAAARGTKYTPTAALFASESAPYPLPRVDVITPRQTRLFSTADLTTFRRTILSCVAETSGWDRRASAVIVPSHAAADQLRWTLEQQTLDAGTAQVLPLLLTRDELYAELHRRADAPPPLLGPIERLVCGRAAADEALASGMDPPFRLRPGLVSEFLGLYDELQRRHRSVDTFERLLVDELDPNAEFDRGARRMLRQTRFLAAMYRAYERRVGESGRLDEHGLRRLVLDGGLRRPLHHLVVTVADRAADPDGLWSGDYDLLSRLPGLVCIDLVTTATLLATGLRERLSDLLPGVDETRVETQDETSGVAGPRLVTPDDGSGRLHHIWRDREEELLAIVRQVKRRSATERTAVVFQRPLPYLYLSGQIFPSAGVPYETRDTLPLAAEPFAAALDLVLSFVASGFARQPLIELLRSPHLHFEQDGHPLEPRWCAPWIERYSRRATGGSGPNCIVSAPPGAPPVDRGARRRRCQPGGWRPTRPMNSMRWRVPGNRAACSSACCVSWLVTARGRRPTPRPLCASRGDAPRWWVSSEICVTHTSGTTTPSPICRG